MVKLDVDLSIPCCGQDMAFVKAVDAPGKPAPYLYFKCAKCGKEIKAKIRLDFVQEIEPVNTDEVK